MTVTTPPLRCGAGNGTCNKPVDSDELDLSRLCTNTDTLTGVYLNMASDQVV